MNHLKGLGFKNLVTIDIHSLRRPKFISYKFQNGFKILVTIDIHSLRRPKFISLQIPKWVQKFSDNRHSLT
jgi:phosphoribosylpyrophosphate synthetase